MTKKKPKIYDLNEKFGDYEFDYLSKIINHKNLHYIVYYYETGDYEGSGTLVAKIGRKYYWYSLSHCSCYGPTDNIEFKEDEGLTLNELRRDLDDMGYQDYINKSVIKKVNSLEKRKKKKVNTDSSTAEK